MTPHELGLLCFEVVNAEREMTRLSHNVDVASKGLREAQQALRDGIRGYEAARERLDMALRQESKEVTV